MFVCAECGWAQPVGGRCNDGTELQPIGDDLLLGTTIGVYRVARLLGIGGMGRVYKAVHPQIGSRVAIKVLSRECSDRRDLVDRFFSEAKAVNLIRHENIVNVLDLAMLPDGRPVIIMEYLDGASLSAIIADAEGRGGRLPLGGIARLTVEVLDALGAAHAKGIVHRDLKPDNVFVTPGGRCKVLDFGIAKLRPEDGVGGAATVTGSLLGTPHYMSPEQATGRPVDHRADLYAMGVMLYECATLQKPFVADSLFDLLRKHIEEPVRPPSQLRPDISAALDSVVGAALGKLPDDRFASAAPMSQALQNATASLAPDQWTPIVPGAAAAAPPGPNWAGTPPRWAGARAPVPSPPGQAPTVASGRRPTVATGKSHKGWFVLGALAIVVAGGVATVALVTRGGAEPTPVAREVNPHPTPAPRHVDALDREVDKAMTHAMDRVNAEIDRSFDKAGVPPAPASPSAPTSPASDEQHTPDGWLVRHELAPYAGFDPRRVDVAAFITWATGEAKKSIADATLIRVDVDNVDPTGLADLTLPSFASGTGTIDVRFISTSRVPPDPKGPKPFGFAWKCEFRVIAGPDGIELRGMEGFPCSESAVRAPRCTAAAVWTKTHRRDGRADLLYRLLPTGKPGWDFTIRGSAEQRVTDDC